MPRSKGVPYTPRKETANETERTEGGSARQHRLRAERVQQRTRALRRLARILLLSGTLYTSTSPCSIALDTPAKGIPIPGGSRGSVAARAQGKVIKGTLASYRRWDFFFFFLKKRKYHTSVV